MKKIKMNKDDMVLNKYRAVIPYGEQEITIENINKKLRDELIEEMMGLIENGAEVNNKEIINKLVDNLVNVEFEVPITDIENPSHHVNLIMYYINEIINEFVEEVLLASDAILKQSRAEVLVGMAQDETIKVAEQIKMDIENKHEDDNILKNKNANKKINSRRRIRKQ